MHSSNAHVAHAAACGDVLSAAQLATQYVDEDVDGGGGVPWRQCIRASDGGDAGITSAFACDALASLVAAFVDDVCGAW